MTESFPVLPLKQEVVFVVDDEELTANTLAIILNQARLDTPAFFPAPSSDEFSQPLGFMDQTASRADFPQIDWTNL